MDLKSASAKSPKRKRVLTQARREQNRVAQQVFRERKRRLNSQQRVKSPESLNNSPDGNPKPSPTPDAPNHRRSAATREVVGLDERHHDQCQPVQVSECQSAPQTAPASALVGCGSIPPDPSASNTLFSASTSIGSHFTAGECPPADLLELPEFDRLASVEESGLVDCGNIYEPFVEPQDGATNGGAPELCTEAQPTSFTNKAMDKLQPDFDLLGHLYKAISQGSLTFEDLLRLAAEAVPTDPSVSSQQSLVRKFLTCKNFKNQLLRSARGPDPYHGHLQLHSYSLVAACLQNAAIIGVDILALVPSHSTKYTSPFFSTLKSFGGAAQFDAAQSVFSNIALDLQPCPRQLLDDHDIYMDTFPLPSFRERVLALRSLPEIFDEHELIGDLDREGLICWGTPWDKRSWEARPWFLKKWWMVLGGKDDQIVENSRWFWAQRGEYHDLSGARLRL